MQLRERSDLSFAPRSSFLLCLPFLSPSQCSVCVLGGRVQVSVPACECARMCVHARGASSVEMSSILHTALGLGPKVLPLPPVAGPRLGWKAVLSSPGGRHGA